MNILANLRDRFQEALRTLVDEPAELLETIIATQESRFGDYQANCAMPLAKRLGQPPREIAGRIVAVLDVDHMCAPPEVAGPGFINLRLSDAWILQQCNRLRRDPRLGIAAVTEPRTYVVDYSSPNVAKSMHVGHIRSTVIGDALCRTLRFLGHHVISDNHLGDWGTQFGMIIYGYRHFLDHSQYQISPVAELGRVYRIVRQLADYHAARIRRPELAERLQSQQAAMDQARAEAAAGGPPRDKGTAKAFRKLEAQATATRDELAALDAQLQAAESNPQLAQHFQPHADIGAAVLQETARLHAGDSESRRLWEALLPKCRQEVQRIYDRLGVSFDYELGESFYQGRLAQVVDDFVAKGYARDSDGAICVFLDQYDAPMIIRKQDGAFLYATTDLATIAYRMERWKPDVILYVVDFRQREHFDKLFAAARLWGFTDVVLIHIGFGTVLGDDGRPFKTRSGDTVELEGLLDEAVRRAAEIVAANDDAKPGGPELSTQQRQHVAQVIGHAAIKYADLSQNRTSDYVFGYDKMVGMQGNTATYMQYSYARIQNIFAKGSVDIDVLRESDAAIRLTGPSERALSVQLLRFPEALEDMMADYRPNQLTSYLYELARRFAEFYEACPVLKAESAEVRDSRLLLCDMVGRTLRLGLSLLGINVVEKM